MIQTTSTKCQYSAAISRLSDRCGVIWLLTMFVLALRKQLPAENAVNLEMAALYWHFVDVVWIIIFPVVYLMQ